MRKKENENLDFFESDLFKQALKEYDIKRMDEVQRQLDKAEFVPIYMKTYSKIEKSIKRENMNMIDKIYFYSNKIAMGLVVVATISLLFL